MIWSFRVGVLVVVWRDAVIAQVDNTSTTPRHRVLPR